MQRYFVVVVLSLIFLGIIAYLPSFSAQLFWDDDDFILNNTYVIQANWPKFFTAQAVEGAGKVSNYFRPVQFSLYTLLYQLFGPNAFVFHAASIFTHIGASIALLWFIKRLTGQNAIALVICLVFLLHPLQTEAVSYASGISDPLQALFGFSSLTLFLTYKQANQPKIHFFLASLFCFILAVLSKESGIIFLGIIGLLVLIPKHNHKIKLQSLYTQSVPLLPFLGVAVLYLFYHTRVIDVIDMAQVWGKIPYAESVTIRVVQFLSILPQYINLLLFPLNLFYERDFTLNILTSVWHLPAFITASVVLSLGIVFAFFHKRFYTKKSYLLLFSFGAFFISLFPYAGIILINGIMYEHFLYVPLVFFFLMLYVLISDLEFTKTHKTAVILGLTLISLLYLGRSWLRQIEWQNPIKFYQQTLDFAPKSFRVLNNLGMALANKGDYHEALNVYTQAISLNPTIPNPYHNIGNIYFNQGKINEAETYFLKAISVDAFFGYSYASLLKLYAQTGQVEKHQKIIEEIATKFK